MAVAHRGFDAGLLAALAESQRSVLRAVIRMVDDVLRPALPERHLQRIQNQLRTQVIGHAPAHNAPAEGIQHDGEIQKTGPGRNVGDVHHPQLVQCHHREIPLHQIRSAGRLGIAHHRRGFLTPGNPLQSRGPHQPGDRFCPTHSPSSRRSRRIRARRKCPWNGHERPGPAGSAPYPEAPVPKGCAAAKHNNHCAKAPAHGIASPRRTRPDLSHESESRRGSIRSPWQTRPRLFKISSSTLSCLFSRRSRRSSSRSAIVRPSARRPSSRSAWATQICVSFPVK